ncbi:hypothetical protein B0H15DRAFT_797557 [Mycena belliarum]|uniref:Chromo domain-containing protein n=1 Tax=Mycena belliarum TaxID=1033014 RepID=A0AAD6UEH7_9AGAR|nr:hypothetical protein B0H15DRAFT_797557 [Mycena belliae]
MSEYEVESVTEARVAKKSKKIIWEYHVKWKGYSSDDNTQVLDRRSFWEPVASFSGSEDILERFWARVDVGNRDIKNMTQFKLGETFFPVGAPRRKSTKMETVAPTPLPSAGPSTESTRASKRRRSSPLDADMEKPAKRTRGRVAESVTRSTEEPRTPRELPRRPPAKPSTSSARSIRRSKKRTPSPEFVPASEEDEDDNDVLAMLVDPQSAADPQKHGNTVDFPLNNDVPILPAEPMQADTLPLKALPPHRARMTNPLVKMVDDFTPVEGAISVKARLQGRNGASSETPVAGPSRSSTRTTPRKPGPGRSSAGLLTKNNSLLTFNKGALKTVKGKFTAPDDALADEGGGLKGGSGMSDITVPPTSDELLKLGGLDSTDIDRLDDFEEDVSVPLQVPENTNDNLLHQQSLALAKNKLFPPGMSMAETFSNKVTSVWRRATIFGPLGLGSDIVPEMPSESKPFVLKLDATVAVPLDLMDVSQSLDAIMCKESSGPPGKFFSDINAGKLLDTVRAGGPSARAAISDIATEEQKSHFTRFHSRLNQGELFTAMVGTVFLAFCSSETPLMQRLNLPATLVALPNSIFVTQAIIEDFSAYLEVVETADTSRW